MQDCFLSFILNRLGYHFQFHLIPTYASPRSIICNNLQMAFNDSANLLINASFQRVYLIIESIRRMEFPKGNSFCDTLSAERGDVSSYFFRGDLISEESLRRTRDSPRLFLEKE